MAAKGSAAKSASGASMSKYDVEVEKRLQALEAEAHAKCHHGEEDVDTDRLSALENARKHTHRTQTDTIHFYCTFLSKKTIIQTLDYII